MGDEFGVAMVEPVGGHSGMDYYDLALCNSLYQAGVSPTLYTCDETTVPSSVHFPVKLVYRQIYGDDPAWWRGLRYLRGTGAATLDAVRHARIVHFHTFHIGVPELLNIVLGRAGGLRVVLTAHDVRPFAPGLAAPRLTHRAYHLADHIICHSRVALDEVQRLYGVDGSRLSYIPMGNFLNAVGRTVDQTAARRSLGLPERGNVLLFFGQIKAVKGLDLLLRALPRVLVAYPDTTLLVAGRVWKDDVQKYRRLIEEHNLGRHCQLHIRYIPNEEMPLFYGAADLVVLPYRRIYQSAVLLMAMAYERPVLASDLPGMREVITDGENGFLFSSENVDALALRIVQLLEAPLERIRAVRQAAEVMQTRHSWEQIGLRTAACYRNLR